MTEKTMTQEQFLELLPSELRDFHDQKDLFKAIHGLYSKNSENKIPGNWADNHVFTIDFFLWFMAQAGYRLTRFKSKKFKQFDLHKMIEEQRNERVKLFSDILRK